MAHISALDCCGIKEFAQAQLLFKSSSSLKEDAHNALLFLLRNWYTQGTVSVINTRGLWDKHYLPKRVPLKDIKYVGGTFAPRAYNIVFSDNNTRAVHWGQALADYITSLDIGPVTRIPEGRNPNTDNLISMFVWSMDIPATRKWLEAQPYPTEWRKDGSIVETPDGYTDDDCLIWDALYAKNSAKLGTVYKHDYDRTFYSTQAAHREFRALTSLQKSEKLAELKSKSEQQTAEKAKAVAEQNKIIAKGGTGMAVRKARKPDAKYPGKAPGRITSVQL
jgi:hypothetical protein